MSLLIDRGVAVTSQRVDEGPADSRPPVKKLAATSACIVERLPLHPRLCLRGLVQLVSGIGGGALKPGQSDHTKRQLAVARLALLVDRLCQTSPVAWHVLVQLSIRSTQLLLVQVILRENRQDVVNVSRWKSPGLG